ncbi:MAGE family domain-containing protein [Trichoderma austrokoningii]
MPPRERRRRPVEDDGESDEEARPRQRPHIEEASATEQEEESPDEEDTEMSDTNSTIYKQLARKLVRYAIACEYSRTPIRRDGIKERVLGKHSRSFRIVFDLAQAQLRAVWGMEFRELPVREKITLHEKRQAMKSSTQSRSGSGAYVLSSTLPEEYRSSLILRPSKTPSAEREAMHIGFYTLLVSLIWLSGGELSEQKLQRSLLRLNADRMLGWERTEVVLKRLERQGYLVKKVDRPQVGYEGDQTITWHVGPRAKEEIGLDGVMGLVHEVYGYPEDEAFDKKLRLSLGLRSKQTGDGQGQGQGGNGNDVSMTNGA